MAYLTAAQCCCLADARGEERAKPGSCSSGSAKGAPRPGHSTAARSPAGERTRRRGGRRRRRDLAASPWSLGDELRREEESSEAKRESVRVKMKLGLREARSAGVFDAPSCALHRRSEINGQEGSGLFWPRRALLLGRNPGPGPGCGLGAGERAPRGLSARMGRGSWAGFAGARARVSRPWAARVLAGPKWSNE